MPNGKVVVITGASAGIGRALARRFARDGAQIGLLARGAEGLAATVEEVNELGGRPLPIEVDVADPDAVDAAATKVEQELGPIDIWINNAAVDLFGRVEDISPDEIRRVSDVTYHGAVWGTKSALQRMRERGAGTIVQIGSAAGYRAIPLQSAYSAAKYALRGFTEALRTELLHDNIDIHLTMVQLSAINTPLYTWARNHMDRKAKPIPPVYQPELAADIIYWAAQARRREVIVGWSAIGLIGLDKIAPGLVDRILARTAFAAQQTAEAVEPNQPNNLFEPVAGDFGARGTFNDGARERAPLVRMAARLGAGGLRLVGALGLLLLVRD